MLLLITEIITNDILYHKLDCISYNLVKSYIALSELHRKTFRMTLASFGKDAE